MEENCGSSFFHLFGNVGIRNELPFSGNLVRNRLHLNVQPIHHFQLFGY